jgi:hypothetical protein
VNAKTILAAPAHFVPGIAHGVFKLLPCPLVTLIPTSLRFRFDGGPVAAGIASIAGEVIAITIGWSPAVVWVAMAGETGRIVAAEVRIVRVIVSIISGGYSLRGVQSAVRQPYAPLMTDTVRCWGQ